MNDIIKVSKSHFGISNPVFHPVSDKQDTLGFPPLLEGGTEFETLCPVSKVTGHRANPLTLLQFALSEKNSRLLGSILQEIPSLPVDRSLSDEDKIRLLPSVRTVGTQSEQDNLVRELMNVADVLFPDNKDLQQNVVENQQIKFESNDNPEVNE